MTTIPFYPYSHGSGSITNMRNRTNEDNFEHDIRIIELLRADRTQRRIIRQVFVNWGCSAIAREHNAGGVINKPFYVALCSNKLSFFDMIARSDDPARIPNYTTNVNSAKEWQREGRHVVERHVLNGHSAEGLVIKGPHEQLSDQAPLYTLYVPKKEEYRVHMVKDQRNIDVLFIQKKVHPRTERFGQEDINWKVRNHANGFIFSTVDELQVPADIIVQCRKAMRASKLDFGAIDVIFNQASGKAYVLEINTAPGIEGPSLDKYLVALKELVEQRKIDLNVN